MHAVPRTLVPVLEDRGEIVQLSCVQELASLLELSSQQATSPIVVAEHFRAARGSGALLKNRCHGD